MGLLESELLVHERLSHRERDMARERLLRATKQTNCVRNGCHPIVEQVSALLLYLGTRLNEWAVPAERRIQLGQ